METQKVLPKPIVPARPSVVFLEKKKEIALKKQQIQRANDITKRMEESKNKLENDIARLRDTHEAEKRRLQNHRVGKNIPVKVNNF